MPTGFRKDIEGLRAVSICLVVAYHAGVPPFSGGYVGVDVFFVLSGYLITGHLLREIEETGTISLLSFYAKRARRLLPASFTVLAFVSAVVFVVPRWFPSVILPQLYGRSISWDIQRSALYIVNWLFAERSISYQGSGQVGTPLLHFWSLAVEEQFYAVWPVLFLLVLVATKRSRAALALVVVVVTVASFTWSVHLSSISPNEAYFVTTTRVWEMSLGGIGAFISRELTGQGLTERGLTGRGLTTWHGGAIARLRTVMSTASVLAIIGASVVFDAGTVYPGYAALVPTLAALWLVVAGVQGPMRSAFNAMSMQWIGARSYSLYLWHWPVLWLATSILGPLGTVAAAAAVAVSFVPAAASYRFVETPFRTGVAANASARFTVGTAALVSAAGFAFGALLLITTTGGVSVAAQPEPATQVAGVQLVAQTLSPEAGSVRYDVPAGYSSGCFLTLHDPSYRECVVGDESAPSTIIVFGNSHAAHWAPALDALAARHEWKLIYIVHDGCRISISYEQSEICASWVDHAWQRLPELIANENVAMVLTSPPPPAERAGDVRATYDSAFASLSSMGAPAAMIVPPPRGKTLGVDCPTPARSSLDACAAERTAALRGYSMLSDAAHDAGMGVIDLTDYFCTDRLCPAVIDDLWVRRDDSHLTRVFAVALTDAVESSLRSLLPELLLTGAAD